MQTPTSLTSAKTTKKRFHMLALIFVSVVINYMDRTNISVAASALSDDLDLNSVQMGAIFGAFGATYALMQIPGGVIVDFLKARILYPVLLIAWSLVTLVQGLVSSFTALIGCRMAIGIFEAPSYPCNNKIVTLWFPETERASAIAVYTSGQFIGLALLMPVLTLIQSYYGWRGLFIISGLIGIVWAVVWYIFYRDPKDHSSVNEAELQHINEGVSSNSDEASDKPRYTKQDFIDIYKSPKMWGIFIGQFCLGGTTMFFLTWFPTYLVEYRGLDFIKSGFLASLPFIGAFVGILISGFLSDFLARSGISKEVSRKAPVIIGMLLSTCIIGANYTESTFWIITFLSIAFFGNGLASITWVFVSLLAPKRYVGLVGGSMNAVGGLSAVVVPWVIGALVQGGDFAPGLVFVAALAFVGMASYLFLVGKIEVIKISNSESTSDVKGKSYEVS